MLLFNKKVMRFFLVFVVAMGLSACANNLQTRVSGNLGNLSSLQTVAILPVEVQSDDQMEMARMFRQNLHANLRQSSFKVLEHYIVDGQLQNHGLMDPAKYGEQDPIKFGEALGVDAVLMSRINRIQKTYFLIHSSIEFSVSVQMVDTRNGEILWVAEQTDSDIQGIAKIPTGFAAAVIAPIYLVTNKLKLNQLTSKMVDNLTALVKFPNQAADSDKFYEPKIATAWNGGGKDQPQKVYWSQVVGTESLGDVRVRYTQNPKTLKKRLRKQIPAEFLKDQLKENVQEAKAGEQPSSKLSELIKNQSVKSVQPVNSVEESSQVFSKSKNIQKANERNKPEISF